MSQPETDLKARILDTIQGFQEGLFNRTDKVRYDPAITGCGVGIWPLAGKLADIDPEVVVWVIRELAKDGKIEAIDPDARGLVSYVVKKRANE